MTDAPKPHLTLVQVLQAVAMLVGLLAAASAWIVLPSRMDAADQRQQEIRTEVQEIRNRKNLDHELLVRIDERASSLQREVRDMRRELEDVKRSVSRPHP